MARREGARGGVYDRFRERLMVPLVDPGGRVVGFGARALGDESPKYLNSPESPVYHKGGFLFGLDRARRAVGPEDELIVVEGYFDAIAMHQAGLRNTVATSGTALTPDQVRMMRRLVGRVLLTYDGDEAGREAMLRSLGVLLAGGLDVRVADLPQGDDPDSLIRRDGRAGWQAMEAQTYDPVEFIQRHVLRRGGSGDPTERALQAVARLLAEVPDPVRVRRLAERADQVFGVRREVIERAVQLRRAGHSEERPLQAAVQARRAAASYAERLLLQALLHRPELLPVARERVDAADFRDAENRALAELLISGGVSAALDSPLGRTLLQAGAAPRDWGAEVEACTRRLQRRRLEDTKRRIDERLRQPLDPEETRRLQGEIVRIGQLLKQLSP